VGGVGSWSTLLEEFIVGFVVGVVGELVGERCAQDGAPLLGAPPDCTKSAVSVGACPQAGKKLKLPAVLGDSPVAAAASTLAPVPLTQQVPAATGVDGHLTIVNRENTGRARQRQYQAGPLKKAALKSALRPR